MSVDTCPQCNQPLESTARFCGVCGEAVYDGDAPERFLGLTISEKFLVQEIVGVGSMGVVYLAEQLSLSKLVALKVLKRTLVYDQEALQRFHLEARAASLLDHPNTISIIDFGQCDDGSPFIAMEYIDGQDLAQVVTEEFPLSPTRIIHIMKQVCSALDEAHAAGIIHRDLKLANIMISQRRTGEEFVKVLDFGIAKMADPTNIPGGGPQTREGLIAGTPAFMSPEQIRGEELDSRTDIYSLGVVLFMLLTGRLPFQGQTAADIAAKVLTEKAPRPSRVRLDLDVPKVFDGITAKAMARDRDARFASAEELRRALESAQAQLNRPTTGSHAIPTGAGARPARAPAPLPTLRGAPGNARVPSSASRGAAFETTIMGDEFAAGSTKVGVPSYDLLKADAIAAASNQRTGGNPTDPNMATSLDMGTELQYPIAASSAEMRSVSRLGPLIGLIAFVLIALAASTGAYFLLINTSGDPDPNDLNARAEHLLTVSKARGKAAYHVQLGLVRADEAARAPDAARMLATTDATQVPAVDDEPKDGEEPTTDDGAAEDVPEDAEGDAEQEEGEEGSHKTMTFEPQVLPSKEARKRREEAAAQQEASPDKETPPAADAKKDAPPRSAYQRGIDAMKTNPREALGHFKIATQQNSRNRAAWIHVSRLAMRLGQAGEAKRACLRVIALSRNRDAARLTCEKMLKR